MNRDMLEGRWTEVRGRIRETWGSVTDDDLQKVRGNWEQLVGRIQQKSGQAREEVESRLNQLLSRINDEADEETHAIPRPAADNRQQ